VTTPVHVAVAPPGAHAYRITVGAGLSARLEELLAEAHLGGPRATVSSTPVWRAVRDAIGGAIGTSEPILIPDGERAKTLATVSRIYDALLRAQADRSTAIVAVGGGVVGDVAGFAAATFMRGVPIVHVPTTLLAQVDSAVGGKVGVNHPLGKNLIGAFHQPRAVVVDPSLLGTLARREFRSGLYEVIKYGMIASPGLFDRLAHGVDALFDRDPSVLVPVIAECCAIKAGVVQRDEREQGERRTLNFGHTIGHALEAITGYRVFRHGEAVAYGMLGAAALAVRRGVLAPDVGDALANLVAQLGPLPPVGDLSATAAVEAIRRDKKVVRGALHFVMPVAIGRTEIVNDVTEREILAAVQELGLR
jgi:3-dehydroquinate synthase